ncbi:MAG TPA: hypothetical protein VMU81_20960 [Acetobacteraceae bacterium]|jgi:uncharacterized protein with HEPN domain|nr:hypothetical protein [Acetobacteraceae bacterium]
MERTAAIAKLKAHEVDWRVVERGVEIISEANRHLPADMKASYPDSMTEGGRHRQRTSP